MIPIDAWRLGRLQTLVILMDRNLRSDWPIDAPVAWRAVAQRADGTQVAAGVLDLIAEALEAPRKMERHLALAYDHLEEDFSNRFETESFEFALWEEQRSEHDPALLAAMADAEPAVARTDRLVRALLATIKLDTGGMTPSAGNRTLTMKLVKRSLGHLHDPTRQTRLDAAWCVLAPWLRDPTPTRTDAVRRLITVFRSSMPAALTDAPPLDPRHPASHLLAPLVRLCLLPGFAGLRYDLKDVKRAMQAKPRDRATALLGLALLLADPPPGARHNLERMMEALLLRWNPRGSRYTFTQAEKDQMPALEGLPADLRTSIEAVMARGVAEDPEPVESAWSDPLDVSTLAVGLPVPKDGFW